MSEETITLAKADLDAIVTNAVARAVAAMETVVANAAPVTTAAPQVEYGKTIDLTDAEKVAKSGTAKKVAKYFKGGDANAPISWRQRKRLLAISENGLAWEDLDGLTSAQGAVASFYMEKRHPVRFGELVITPHLTK